MEKLKIGQNYEGIINISTKGIGFVKIRELKETIEIPRESLNKAFHGDMVSVLVKTLDPDENPKGVVTEITRRAKIGYSGTLSF